MREVNYEGQELPVAIFWDNTNEPELMVGEYSVDLFADGNIIGKQPLKSGDFLFPLFIFKKSLFNLEFRTMSGVYFFYPQTK